jgi:hypothetical protein
MCAIIPDEQRSPCVGDILRVGEYISPGSPGKRTYTAFYEVGNSSIVVYMVAGMKVRFSMPSKREDLYKLFGEATIILRSGFSNVQNKLPPLLAFDVGPTLSLEEALAKMQEDPTCEIVYVPHY